MFFKKMMQHHSNNAHHKKKDVFILSAYGRGSRAYLNAHILREIESEMRMQGLSKQLTSYFDVYVGSSLGSLVLALLLLETYSLDDIVEFFKLHLKGFFRPNRASRSMRLFGKPIYYKYSSEDMVSCLRGMFGNIQLNFFQSPLLLQCYDILNHVPFTCTQSNMGNIELYKILFASLSCPDHLPPVYFREDEMVDNAPDKSDVKLCEGSLFQAHPSMTACAYALKYFSQDTRIHILTVGDGRLPISTSSYNTYKYGWASLFHDAAMLQMADNSAFEQKEQFLLNLPRVFHVEINGHLNTYEHNNYYDFSSEYFELLEKDAFNIVHQNRVNIKNFISKLKDKE